jgi:hypothetical protein
MRDEPTLRRLSDPASRSPEAAPANPRAGWPHAGGIAPAYGLARRGSGTARLGRIQGAAPSLVLEPYVATPAEYVRAACLVARVRLSASEAAVE